MGIENLLSRLEGVKAGSAAGRWIARCPAHADRSPSLTIRLEEDGRILLHDFAGCETLRILQAIGLDFADVFPERLGHHYRSIHRPFSALDALKCLTQESSIVVIAASDIVTGRAMSDRDLSRIAIAAGRLASALEVVHG